MTDEARIEIATSGVSAIGREIPDIERADVVAERIEAAISEANMRLMCAMEGSIRF